MRKFDPNKIPRVLSEEEIARMFAVSEENPRDNMLLKCMYYLGMKPGEITRFRVEDIDYQRNIVHIRGKQARQVPVPEEFMKELKKFTQGKTGLVFHGRYASISTRHIRRLVKGYACKANVRFCEKIHPHTLRHSYAVHLQKNGVSVPEIQRFLGHKRKETTDIYYTYISFEKFKK